MKARLAEFFLKYDIKGFLTEEEGLLLYRYALQAESLGPCLEIGSYCGKSSIYIGSACQQTNNILFAVDHHRGSEEHQPGEEYHDVDLLDCEQHSVNTFPEFQKNIHSAKLQDSVIAVVASSQTLAKSWKQTLGLIFIDGGHSEAQAVHDVLHWSEYIVVNGFLLIHDIYDTPEEGGQAPRIAMNALFDRDQRRWEQVERLGSLVVLRRK